MGAALLLPRMATSAADRIVGQFQGRTDGAARGHRGNPGFKEFVLGQLADLHAQHGFAVLQRGDDGVELAMPKRMVGVEGTIFFDIDRFGQLGIPAAIIVDQKLLGMTEVLFPILRPLLSS